MKRPYSIAYGKTDEHSKQLEVGLKKLGPDFIAEICPVCMGHGQHEQTYTLGCDLGYIKMMGVCDWCNGTGLLQGTVEAPLSVVNQVLNAGS